MSKPVSNSEYYMWRTVVATAHADNKLTNEEIRFLAEKLEDISFTTEQNAQLVADIKKPQDVVEMFKGITDVQDQARFFNVAREVVWIDGDYGEAEQTVMLKLKKAHVATVDIDALIGKTNLKLDDNIN